MALVVAAVCAASLMGACSAHVAHAGSLKVIGQVSRTCRSMPRMVVPGDGDDGNKKDDSSLSRSELPEGEDVAGSQFSTDWDEVRGPPPARPGGRCCPHALPCWPRTRPAPFPIVRAGLAEVPEGRTHRLATGGQSRLHESGLGGRPHAERLCWRLVAGAQSTGAHRRRSVLARPAHWRRLCPGPLFARGKFRVRGERRCGRRRRVKPLRAAPWDPERDAQQAGHSSGRRSKSLAATQFGEHVSGARREASLAAPRPYGPGAPHGINHPCSFASTCTHGRAAQGGRQAELGG